MSSRENQATDKRVGVVAIIVQDRNETYNELNEILHQFSAIIIGRMGLPYRDRNISIIALIVDGSNEQVGALSGKIGQLKNIHVKTMFAKLEPVS